MAEISRPTSGSQRLPRDSAGGVPVPGPASQSGEAGAIINIASNSEGNATALLLHYAFRPRGGTKVDVTTNVQLGQGAGHLLPTYRIADA